MKGYKMQVRVDGEWKDVHLTNAAAYEYQTREEAFRMLSMCYPDQILADKLSNTVDGSVRIVKG